MNRKTPEVDCVNEKMTSIPPNLPSQVVSLIEERKNLTRYTEEVTEVLDDTRYGIECAIDKIKKRYIKYGRLDRMDIENIESFLSDILEDSIIQTPKPRFLIDREEHREAKRMRREVESEKRIQKIIKKRKKSLSLVD